MLLSSSTNTRILSQNSNSMIHSGVRVHERMNDTNQGWKQQDEHYLRKFDNAQADPDIQILTEDNLVQWR
ncbi:MAG: hypothetical protein ACRD8W_07730 [Nitrososphaeraceae archaeon]